MPGRQFRHSVFERRDPLTLPVQQPANFRNGRAEFRQQFLNVGELLRGQSRIARLTLGTDLTGVTFRALGSGSTGSAGSAGSARGTGRAGWARRTFQCRLHRRIVENHAFDLINRWVLAFK